MESETVMEFVKLGYVVGLLVPKLGYCVEEGNFIQESVTYCTRPQKTVRELDSGALQNLKSSSLSPGLPV